MRYVVVGGIGAATSYGLFAAAWLLFGTKVPYLALALMVNVLAAVLLYPLFRRAVFRWTGPILPGLMRFAVVYLWGISLTLIGLPLLVEVGRVHVLLAQAILITVNPLINYQLHRLWSFRVIP